MPSLAATPPADAPEMPPAAAGSVTVDGQVVALPVEVRSAKMIAATFLVSADAAQRLIAYSGLRVASKQRGTKAICSLSAVQYTDNDLGPYNEFAFGFMVEPEGPGPFAKGAQHTFLHKLPVNQEFTCMAGKGIWGFPKWVTDITFVDEPGRNGLMNLRGHTTSVLTDGGELVCALGVRHSPLPMPSRPMEMVAYSWCDGVLRRTPWTTRNRSVTGRIGGASLALGANHPIADEMRSLGLPKGAVLSLRTPLMAATFGLPEVL